MHVMETRLWRAEPWLEEAEAHHLPFLTPEESAEQPLGFPTGIAHVENVLLLPGDWLLLGEHGLLIESLDAWMPSRPEKARHIARHQDGVVTLELPEHTRTIEEPCVLLGDHASHYHWMMFYLPRVIALQRHPDLSDLRVIVSDRIAPQQIESLRLAGIGEDRLMKLSDDAVYRCESLWVPSMLTNRIAVHPVALRWLRATYLGPDRPAQGTRRIFVSRSDAPQRHLVNEDEMAGVLAPLGFERVWCSRMGFAEQARLFCEAAVVLGGTGAAFSNVTFAPSGTRVIELHNYGGAQFFEFLCRQLGQRYHRLIGELRPKRSGELLHNCDYFVPGAAVLEYLASEGIGESGGV